VGIAVGAVVGMLLVCGGCDAGRHESASTTSTTLRPCREFPVVETGNPIAPDGYYLVSIGRDPGTVDRVSLYLDNGGAGFSYVHVPVSPSVTVITSSNSPKLFRRTGRLQPVPAPRSTALSAARERSR
jgi:hypothetical protein